MERKEVTRMLVGVQPRGHGTIRVVGAKLHGIVVTESKLNYHGSITIDTDILEAARLLPLEYVYIWNKHSGARIETYVLPGPRGSGVVCLNGAAARTCQVGDEIIVASSREIPVAQYHDGFACRVLTFDQTGGLPNRVAELLEYRVAARDEGTEFVIMDMATGREWIS
ncbi:aspartate 1-decarboxylase [uncultured Desulfovibrio sp.]|uniref:aspartate 1-decarboxylase n=1 Tax=uncultured Desulfovibrio sp. TaxID=167968 RepID=UPI00262968D7|nr:aspartate 1-decarboxylase [uncultured Desulfovibrio sp.]